MIDLQVIPWSSETHFKMWVFNLSVQSYLLGNDFIKVLNWPLYLIKECSDLKYSVPCKLLRSKSASQYLHKMSTSCALVV